MVGIRSDLAIFCQPEPVFLSIWFINEFHTYLPFLIIWSRLAPLFSCWAGSGEIYFGSSQQDILTLKLLIVTYRTISTVTGVFDAIEKKYLKDFYFILYTDKEWRIEVIVLFSTIQTLTIIIYFKLLSNLKRIIIQRKSIR